MEGLYVAMIPISSFVLVGFVVWVIGHTRSTRRGIEAQTQIHTRMIDKFGSSEEFVRFLQTPDGKKYLEGFTQSPAIHPADRILGALRAGVIIILLSIGFMVTSFLAGYSYPTQEPPFLIGVIGFFLGAGFVVSALLSQRLSKTMGLLHGNGDSTQGS